MRAVRRAHDRRAEMREHFFGMIARSLGLDHRRLPRRIQSAEQHRGFDLRRSDGRLVFDRQRLARSLQHQRQAAALGLLQNLGALQRQGIENALHRPLAQRGVAVEARDDRMAGDDAHHQPRAGAGVAEIEGLGGLQQRAEPGAPDAPAARRHGARSSRQAGGRPAPCAARPRLREALRSSSRRWRAGRRSARDARRIYRPAGARGPQAARIYGR